MKTSDITEVLAGSISQVVFGAWKHEGGIESLLDDEIEVLIDGREYLIRVCPEKKVDLIPEVDPKEAIPEVAAGKAIREEPAEPVKKKKTKPKMEEREIDKGKIWALRDAKWSISKIADEMRLPYDTVREVLKGERPEGERE